MTYLYVALLLILAAALVFWLASRQRKNSGLPGGEIIYADSRLWQAVAEPYFDSHLRLSGKPDFVIKQGHISIPVEVKTGRTPSAPYDSHIFQLAAYCVLIDRATGLRPPYGILHYPERTYKIDFTGELEDSLLDLLKEMHGREKFGNGVPRSHESEARCRKCGFRKVCDQKLAG